MILLLIIAILLFPVCKEADAGVVLRGVSMSGGIIGVSQFTKGAWGMYYVPGTAVPANILNNTGLVGVLLGFKWYEIEATKDVYDWTAVDARIAEIKAAGKKITLSLVMSAENTPTWLKDDPGVQTLSLLNLNENQDSYCTYIPGPVYWDATFIAQKKELIAIMGARYANDPSIVAVIAQFINWHSDDWELPHDVCSSNCDCGESSINQPQQWLNANPLPYTTARMMSAAQEILNAYATAFPSQALLLPIHVTRVNLDPPPDEPSDRWTYLAEQVVAWADAQGFGNRFFIARHTLKSNTPLASTLDSPTTNEQRIWKLVRDHYPRSGMQEGSAITLCDEGNCSTCRITNYATPSYGCGLSALTNIIDIGLTYNPQYIQFWKGDSQNVGLYSTLLYATTEMNQ